MDDYGLELLERCAEELRDLGSESLAEEVEDYLNG